MTEDQQLDPDRCKRSEAPGSPDRGAARRREVGRYGEDVAARHLVDDGMVVLDRNWRCETGELDLVLRDGRVLVVCEVKTRSSTAYGSPVEAVTAAKGDRLRRLADLWVEDHRVRPAELRIDLVGVLLQRRGAPTLQHVRGVG
ncbi:MAG: YraN family protein [Nocardioidaceae bacterium]